MISSLEALRGVSEPRRSSVPFDREEHLRRLADPARLAALAATELMDELPDASFDRFTRLAARWLRTPSALVSLVDDKRQFFKSALGLGEPLMTQRETPLSHSFCQYAVTSAKPLIVSDAREHPLLRDNLGTTELGAVAYAGMPLVTSDDQVLGALCVVDSQTRVWSDEDIEVLRELADLTMAEIELRLRVKALKDLEAARARDQELLRSILECMNDMVIVTGANGNVVLSNAAARHRLHNPTLASTEQIAAVGVYSEDGLRRLEKSEMPSARAMRGEDVREQQMVIRAPGKPEAVHSVNASPLRDENGVIYAAVGVGRDVTTKRAAERALARSEEVLRTVVKHLPNCAVLLFDRDLRYLAADGAQLLSGVGLSSESLVGRTLMDIASPQALATAEPRYRAALAGESTHYQQVRGDRCYSVSITPVKEPDGSISSGLAFVYDITDHKRSEQAALDQAAISHAISVKDELTQLLNRRGFLDLAQKQLAVALGLQRPALLFFVDLNGMKQINDQLGHEAGDAALVEMADVLRSTFRGSDVLARLGGDEFVALLLDADHAKSELFSAKIQAELERRNQAANRAYQLSASVGAAAYDFRNPESIDALLAKADALMYEQKKHRKTAR